MSRTRRRLEDRGKVSDGFLTEASKFVSRGFNDYIRGRLYRTINPTSGYNLKLQAKEFAKNDSIDYGDIDENKYGVKYIDFDTYTGAPGNLNVIDDIWANYLQIPINRRRFNTRLQKSKYGPNLGKENTAYYKLPLNEYEKELLIDDTNNLKLNSNKNSNILDHYNLAKHTVGRGFDEKGEYRSYYDKWDLNPFNGKYEGTKIPGLDKLGDASFGIGKPVNIYDRIYLDDYYGVKQPTHGVYLPEVTVRGKRSLKNRGK